MARSRVLIVDDSSLSREVLRRSLELDPHLEVAGEATTGEEALKLVRTLKPDLVTMDLNMPGMGGLKAIEALMKERPTPIVVISERSSTSGVDLNYEALSRGALELVPKSAVFGAGDEELRRFIERLRLLAEAGLEKQTTTPPTPPAAPPTIPLSNERPVMLGIGASTGGPRALSRLLSALPRDFPIPVVVVQHMADDFFDSFVRFLRDSSGHQVEQANAMTHFVAGKVYVAPPRQELFVRENLTAKLLPPPPNSLISPSVDSLFFSMATALQGRGLGVLLTGMGDDGAQGLLRMRRMGARTIAQDKTTSAVWGMPKAAVELGAAEHVMDLGDIAGFLTRIVSGQVVQAPAAPPPPAPSAPSLARKQSSSALPVVERTKKTVLVVDAAPQLDGVRTTLERAGFEVLTLDNPMVIARTLRRNTVDLVLLEPEMETMPGSVVVQTLQAHGVQTPVVFWSGLEELSLAGLVRESKAAGWVRKNDPGGLIRTLNRLLKA